MKLNKAILIPLLAAVATFVKEIYGYEIPNEYLDLAATSIIWIIGTLGIFMHPRKEQLSDAEKRYLEQ